MDVFKCVNIKIKFEKKHTKKLPLCVKTVPKFNSKLVEKVKIDNKYITVHFPGLLQSFQ